MSNESNPCETHHDVKTPGGFCPVCLHQRVVDAEREAVRLEAALERLIDAAGPHMAAQDHAPDPRCGMTQPITVEEGEELNDAVANARETITRIHALHSSDAPASDRADQDFDEIENGQHPEPIEYDAPADHPECSCNPGWPENCPVHGNEELEDVVESDRPEPRQMDQATADHLGERIRQARDSALSSSPGGRPQTDYYGHCPTCGTNLDEEATDADIADHNEWAAQTDAQREALEALEHLEGLAKVDALECGFNADAVEQYCDTIRQALSQSGQAVPAAVRRLPERMRDNASRQKSDSVAGITLFWADEIERALATHPADGDSPAVPDKTGDEE